MRKRIAIIVGGVALTAAAAIPVGSAFGASETHCSKVNNAISNASTLIGTTNSGQASNVQTYLNNARPSQCLC